MRANAQRAKQPVYLHQLGSQNLGQLPLGQAAHHFHLKQSVLCVHIAQRPVQVDLVVCLDMGHATLVIAHANPVTQTRKGLRARALDLLGVEVPDRSRCGNSHQQGQHKGRDLQGTFHGAVSSGHVEVWRSLSVS